MTLVPPVTTGRQPAAGRSPISQSAGSTRTLFKGDDGVVRRTVLPSGLRIITEQVPGQRSATIGVWVGVGSRDESPALHGCSHFLEHLLFKGTSGRSALDISIALDAVGGEFNAFTSKEYTCFHARVLDEDLPLAVDVLGDMVTSSLISPEDVDAERDVILDEIAMHDDDPDDVAHNLFAAQAWGDSPLGRPIAGTEASIEAMTREQVLRLLPAPLPPRADGRCGRRQRRPRQGRPADPPGVLPARLPRPGPPSRPWHARWRSRGECGAGVTEATRHFEQVNVVLGVNGITRSDDRRFALGVLNAALGGGTSSRLFQEVREKRGLAYSVFSFATQHVDAGLVGVSVGCLPAKLDQVLAVVRAELAKVAESGIDAEELARGKGQLKGGLVLGLEDSASRMSRLGKSELVDDDLLSIDEVLARIDAVTLDDVRALAGELFTQPEILAVVGPR